jgi:4-hydroxybenzoate polyprenyltransferase
MSDAARPARWRDYLELARVSNLPTCLSNVLTGAVLGAGGFGLPWGTVGLVAVAVAAFYVAGMALNDAVDADVDRRERPGRPVPSGRISRRAAYAFAVAALAAGLAATIPIGSVAMLYGACLSVAIVVYDFTHKRFAAAAMLMGLCRGLIYMLAAGGVAAVLERPLDSEERRMLLTFAAALTLYTMMLTLVARVENEQQMGRTRWLGIGILVVALAMLLIRQPRPLIWGILSGSLLLIWLVRAAESLFQRPPKIKQAVLGWLAGFCLLDAFYLTLLNRPDLAWAALACFAVTLLGHRRILGT